MRIKVNIFFEIKAMGYSFYFPLIGFIALSYQLFIGGNLSFFTLKMMEFMIAPLAAWWAIFIYYDYFEEDADQILYTYPISSAEHGWLRAAVFTIFYMILMTAAIIILAANTPGAQMIIMMLHYLPLSLLFASIGFFLMVAARKVMVPILIIVIYVATEYLTNGQSLPWYHAMLFNTEPLEFSDVVIKSMINAGLALILITLGQLIIRLKSK